MARICMAGALAWAVVASSTAMAQESIPGSWKCENDAANGVIQNMPPEPSRIASNTQFFAPKPSRYEAVLANGGPTGMFVRGHLHAIHNDRVGGKTDYVVATLITDNSGYYYGVFPLLKTTVRADGRKPRKHRHCGAQFNLSPELAKILADSTAKGSKLKLEIASSRDRKNALEQLGEGVKAKVDRFLKGEIDRKQLLGLLNAS